MKVLVMFVDEFKYQPAQKNLESVEDVIEGASFRDSILAFIQIEESDEEYDVQSREKKTGKPLKMDLPKKQLQQGNSALICSFGRVKSIG